MYGQRQPLPDHRRKWDTAEYGRRARERVAAESQDDEGASGKAGPKRELLKPREYRVDLESKVGKTVVIKKDTPQAESGGYYCDVCDCVVKDSINFLDHINGRKHQRNMGMSMKVKKCTPEEIRERIAEKKTEKEKEKLEYDYQERLREIEEEEQKMAEYRRQKRQMRKRRKRGDASDDDDEEDDGAKGDMAAMMGFAGFASTGGKS